MSDSDSRVGTDFGHYHLRRLLGKGGMGEVYEAKDTRKDRTVALKVLPAAMSNDPVFRKRLEREARSAGRLQEPHVVPIHDYGEIDGVLYVDMRFIEGTDLRKMLVQYGPLTPARAVAIIRQIASALDAAHESGLVHRDVKPENILITRDDFAYLVDFGIANASTDEKLTELGTAVGTYAYMAPERFTNAEVTYRADIYALACVLYECLTGARPFPADSVSVLITAHLMDSIPKPSAARPNIPQAFDDVIARGMAKDPQGPVRHRGRSRHRGTRRARKPRQGQGGQHPDPQRRGHHPRADHSAARHVDRASFDVDPAAGGLHDAASRGVDPDSSAGPASDAAAVRRRVQPTAVPAADGVRAGRPRRPWRTAALADLCLGSDAVGSAAETQLPADCRRDHRHSDNSCRRHHCRPTSEQFRRQQTGNQRDGHDNADRGNDDDADADDDDQDDGDLAAAGQYGHQVGGDRVLARDRRIRLVQQRQQQGSSHRYGDGLLQAVRRYRLPDGGMGVEPMCGPRPE